MAKKKAKKPSSDTASSNGASQSISDQPGISSREVTGSTSPSAAVQNKLQVNGATVSNSQASGSDEKSPVKSSKVAPMPVAVYELQIERQQKEISALTTQVAKLTANLEKLQQDSQQSATQRAQQIQLLEKEKAELTAKLNSQDTLLVERNIYRIIALVAATGCCAVLVTSLARRTR